MAFKRIRHLKELIGSNRIENEKLNEQKKIHSPWVKAPHVYQKLIICAALNEYQQRYLSVNKQKETLKSIIKSTVKVSTLFT